MESQTLKHNRMNQTKKTQKIPNQSLNPNMNLSPNRNCLCLSRIEGQMWSFFVIACVHECGMIIKEISNTHTF